VNKFSFKKLVAIPITASSLVFMSVGNVAALTFNENHIIEDSVFTNSSSMSPSSIDKFLNSFPSSCISHNNGFATPDVTGYTPSGGYSYGGSVSAGTVISHASQAYGLNPQVMLATLQKEQSLVTGGAGCHANNPNPAWPHSASASGGHTFTCSIGGHNVTCTYACPFGGGCYNVAVGYGCPNYCNTADEGFSKQIIHAAWLLSFGEHRAEGQMNWNVQLTTTHDLSGNVWNSHWDNSDDPQTCYGGPMTEGTFQTCPSGPTVPYDGCTSIGGATAKNPDCGNSTNVHMDNGATAALYWYTPFISGNSHFQSIFAGWFGNPVSPCFETGNIPSPALSGKKVIPYQPGNGKTNLAYLQMNNTGSQCVELHVLSSNYQAWDAHYATGMRAADPSLQMLLPMKLPGSNRSSLIDVVYDGATGHHVAVHGLSADLKKMNAFEVASNLGTPDPTQGTFVTGDFFDRGYDQLMYIAYTGSGGHVNIHIFNDSMTKGVGNYDVATNLPAMANTDGMFVTGDFLGRGYDQLALILYNGSTGHDEIHLFDKSLRQGIGFYDIASDISNINPASGTFVAGDFLGRGYDQLAYIRYAGHAGHVELHIFSPDLRHGIGIQDNVTIMNTFDPST
jgi:hypothetical protein